jgi:hypothetical protein
MFKHAFKPGTIVPKAANYWVHHYQHRMTHLAFIENGRPFPECTKCGARVRFELSPDLQPSEPIASDPDFTDGDNDQVAAS